jgi:hypothetical protein
MKIRQDGPTFGEEAAGVAGGHKAPRHNSRRPAGKPAATTTSFQIVEQRAGPLRKLNGKDIQCKINFH